MDHTSWRGWRWFFSLIAVILLSCGIGTGYAGHPQTMGLTLDDCIDMALKMHPQIDVAEEEVNIASARRNQARSAYFPQLGLGTSYVHLNNDQYFNVPPTGFLKEQLTKKDIYNFSATLKYPVYTGGMIKYLNRQAKLGMDVSEIGREASARDIVFQVKQRYYDVLLVEELWRLARDTGAKFRVMQDLTERLYKEGSGKVTKIDHLQTKMIVGSIKNQEVSFQQDAQLAKEGLKNAIGLVDGTPIEVADGLNYVPHSMSLNNVLEEAHRNYPEWRQVNKGIEAREAGVKVAKSGYFPKVALVGLVSYTEDHFGNLGIFNNDNQPLLAIGGALSMPIFDGFLTHHKIQEAKAELAKTRSQRELLEQGIDVMVKKAYSDLEKGRMQVEVTRQVLMDARESEDITRKAYEMDLKEMEDVIKAQTMAALASAQHLIALHQYNMASAELNRVLGRAY